MVVDEGMMEKKGGAWLTTLAASDCVGCVEVGFGSVAWELGRSHAFLVLVQCTGTLEINDILAGEIYYIIR